jgi:hypothetical protein
MLYVQCQLSRGTTRRTAWLPQKFAVVNRVLKIKDEDGWRVEICGEKMEEKEPEERSRDYLHQREASDV